MDGNIKARHILSMFVEYPERVYPEEDLTDPKKKADKKGKAKKKKKEKPLDYPEWGEELSNVRSTLDTMKKLIAKKVDLKLADSFVSEVDVYIKKMTKEINYR